MGVTLFELGRWAIANIALILFWHFIASRLVNPLRQIWPAVVEVERKPMPTRTLHRSIITFAVICELCLMADSIALIISALTRYGWAQ